MNKMPSKTPKISPSVYKTDCVVPNNRCKGGQGKLWETGHSELPRSKSCRAALQRTSHALSWRHRTVQCTTEQLCVLTILGSNCKDSGLFLEAGSNWTLNTVYYGFTLLVKSYLPFNELCDDGPSVSSLGTDKNSFYNVEKAKCENNPG